MVRVRVKVRVRFSLRAARVHSTHSPYIHATCKRHVVKGLTVTERSDKMVDGRKYQF